MPRAEQNHHVFKRTDAQSPQRFFIKKQTDAKQEPRVSFSCSRSKLMPRAKQSQLFFKGTETKSQESVLPLQRSRLRVEIMESPVLESSSTSESTKVLGIHSTSDVNST